VRAVPATAIVEACEASVPATVKPATMKSTKSGVKPTAMESTAAVKSTASVETPAPAMRAGMGEV
jgi:hypothetical protein